MWIVRLALRKPYTFTVMAILLFALGGFSIIRMPKDIFPSIDIPVVSVIWSYTGLPPQEIEHRIITICERAMTTTVNDIEHIESTSLPGIGVVKVYFQPNAKIEAGVAQVTAINQTILRILPPGTTPPLILQYSASNVPILQLSISSKTLSEAELYDYSLNFIRQPLAEVRGAAVPTPYGGKQRQVMVDLDLKACQSLGVSPSEVSAALNRQNVILPAGTVKIGTIEYQVLTNSSPLVLNELNDLPIKQVNGSTIYIRDVANVRDGFAPQTNVVLQNGQKAALLTILKNGRASTLDVIEGVKKILPRIQSTLPADLEIRQLFDQSIFVRNALKGVLTEGGIAAILTALMILLFLGSWRSTIIVATSIPLSICCSIILLNALGHTLNIMTLGGLALAVGILVDDATVEIENIHRNHGMNKRMVQAILDGAHQIAVPAFVSTLCICIVFVPIFFLTGVSYYLFTPLAMAVVFAMMSSYFLSRTVVPTMALFLLEDHKHDKDQNKEERNRDDSHNHSEEKDHDSSQEHENKEGQKDPHKNDDKNQRDDANSHRDEDELGEKPNSFFGSIHWHFNKQFFNVRHHYVKALDWTLESRVIVVIAVLVVVLLTLLTIPRFLGRDFFPLVDAGQFRLHVRAPKGTRIEETEKSFSEVGQVIREIIPAKEINLISDNIGLPYSGINLAYSDIATIGPADGEILVGLNPGHGYTWGYVKKIRDLLRKRFPDFVFFTQPSDIVAQILNFGLPAPLDVEILGPLKNQTANFTVAQDIEKKLKEIPGAVDVHLQQVTDQPAFYVNVDRTLADQIGLTQNDVATDLLVSLSSSGQAAPNYWVNPANGVNYTLAVQTPQYKIDTLEKLKNSPIAGLTLPTPQLLQNLATITRGVTPAVVSHYSIAPSFDVYANVQDRDLGGVSDEVDAIVKQYAGQPVSGWYQWWDGFGWYHRMSQMKWFRELADLKISRAIFGNLEPVPGKLAKGSQIKVRGQSESMRTSYFGLGIGLIFAIMLVYFLMVVNFQSWIDPFIIIMALPGAICGIVWILFFLRTPLSVPALMGAIMSIGVATSNSILMITFANEQRLEGKNARDAALEAGHTRLRPVVMTALAMIIGMLPMSLGLGEGGEQNAPLGRAVIGGLIMATFATLFFVPAVYTMLRSKDVKREVDPLLENENEKKEREEHEKQQKENKN